MQTNLDNIEDDEFELVESEIEDSKSSGQIKYEISTYPADFTLEVLCSKWEKGDIIIPDFQRKFVWETNQSSRLIESFMLGLPVPPIFFYVDKKANSLVIDGQQRLKSVFYFLGKKGKKDISPQEEKLLSYKLKGLSEDSPWYNKTFLDFTEEDQTRFKDCILRAIIVKQLDPNDDTSIYHIFERLNTGGTLLNNQEIRNCVYSGPFNLALLRLNKLDSWRQVFTKSIEDNRQKDVELILRFFALYDSQKNYKKPMKEFLSEYIGNSQVRFMETSKIEERERVFTNTINKIIEHLGNRPFHVRSGLNSAVCDSVMVAFANNLDKIPPDILARYRRLNNNSDYIYYTSKSTNDVASVNGRMLLANKYLFGDN